MKLSAIFVDDEPNVVQGLQRMLYPLRNEWEMYFCGSGKDALKIIAEKNIDVIVTDMRMPEMDGAQLLKKIKSEHPNIVRIILSGFSEKESMLRVSNVAHQFLTKPCDANYLKSNIERIFKLRKCLNNEHVLKIVTGAGTLPSLPDLYLKLEAEIKSPNISLKKIGDIIASDVMMTVKILQMVNSAFFGLPQQINNPLQAVNFLGMDTIKSLVLFEKIFSSFKHSEEVKRHIEDLWTHSFKVAHASKIIMSIEHKDQKSLDQAFIAGLLHDIGKLILLKIPGYYSNVTDLMNTESIDLSKAEEKIYGTNHSAVGAYLIGLWGLSDFIVEVAAFHHYPHTLGDESFSVMTAVHIANSFEPENKLDNDYIESLNLTSKIDEYKAIIKRYEEMKYEQ